jgi:transglutaminase-like putative cysteine protease
MRNKALIDSLILTSENLPKAGDQKFERYAEKLGAALRENICDIGKISFYPANYGEPSEYHAEWTHSYRVSDTFPALRVEQTFRIDPLSPLMPQIEKMQGEIAAIKANLVLAARAIVKAAIDLENADNDEHDRQA